MCLIKADKNHRGLFSKHNTITAWKVYKICIRFMPNKRKKVHLEPYWYYMPNHPISNYGDIISDRDTSTETALRRELYNHEIEKGIHVYLCKKDAILNAGCSVGAIYAVVPIRCNRKYFIAQGFERTPVASRSAVFSQVYLTKINWKRIVKKAHSELASAKKAISATNME